MEQQALAGLPAGHSGGAVADFHRLPYSPGLFEMIRPDTCAAMSMFSGNPPTRYRLAPIPGPQVGATWNSKKRKEIQGIREDVLPLDLKPSRPFLTREDPGRWPRLSATCRRQVFGLAGNPPRKVGDLLTVASRSGPDQCSDDGVRSCSPLRGSPGFAPGSLFAPRRRTGNGPQYMGGPLYCQH